LKNVGKTATIKAWGRSFRVRPRLRDMPSAGLGCGYYSVEDTFAATDTDSIQSLHASLFYRPNGRVTFGGEVIRGERELVNGASDLIARLQTSVQFSF